MLWLLSVASVVAFVVYCFPFPRFLMVPVRIGSYHARDLKHRTSFLVAPSSTGSPTQRHTHTNTCTQRVLGKIEGSSVDQFRRSLDTSGRIPPPPPSPPPTTSLAINGTPIRIRSSPTGRLLGERNERNEQSLFDPVRPVGCRRAEETCVRCGLVGGRRAETSRRSLGEIPVAERCTTRSLLQLCFRKSSAFQPFKPKFPCRFVEKARALLCLPFLLG